MRHGAGLDPLKACSLTPGPRRSRGAGGSRPALRAFLGEILAQRDDCDPVPRRQFLSRGAAPWVAVLLLSEAAAEEVVALLFHAEGAIGLLRALVLPLHVQT